MQANDTDPVDDVESTGGDLRQDFTQDEQCIEDQLDFAADESDVTEESDKLTECDGNGGRPYPATGDMQPLGAQDPSFNILSDSDGFGDGFSDEQEHDTLSHEMSTEDVVPPANATADESVADEDVQDRPPPHTSARSWRQGRLRKETRPTHVTSSWSNFAGGGGWCNKATDS